MSAGAEFPSRPVQRRAEARAVPPSAALATGCLAIVGVPDEAGGGGVTMKQDWIAPQAWCRQTQEWPTCWERRGSRQSRPLPYIRQAAKLVADR
jgi:hypothetical protein